jgi:hypothetical protein
VCLSDAVTCAGVIWQGCIGVSKYVLMVVFLFFVYDIMCATRLARALMGLVEVPVQW